MHIFLIKILLKISSIVHEQVICNLKKIFDPIYCRQLYKYRIYFVVMSFMIQFMFFNLIKQ